MPTEAANKIACQRSAAEQVPGGNSWLQRFIRGAHSQALRASASDPIGPVRSKAYLFHPMISGLFRRARRRTASSGGHRAPKRSIFSFMHQNATRGELIINARYSEI